MKRSREAGEMLESLVMAKYLMLFSQGVIKTELTTTAHSDLDRVFECKTCNRQFSSFQALGGHRASHKKLKSSMEEEADPIHNNGVVVKCKIHECTICRVGFATGQALGGHMRKHKAAINESMGKASSFMPIDGTKKTPAVLKRSWSSKRVMGLDLNLTPLENDLEWMFGKLAPKIDFLK